MSDLCPYCGHASVQRSEYNPSWRHCENCAASWSLPPPADVTLERINWLGERWALLNIQRVPGGDEPDWWEVCTDEDAGDTLGYGDTLPEAVAAAVGATIERGQKPGDPT